MSQLNEAESTVAERVVRIPSLGKSQQPQGLCRIETVGHGGIGALKDGTGETLGREDSIFWSVLLQSGSDRYQQVWYEDLLISVG